jgi:hypothetical protein
MKIVFLGTCQAPIVGRLLHSAARGRIESHGVELLRGITDSDRAWVAEADVVFHQYSERQLYSDLIKIATGRVLRMPMVGARFLWPFVGSGHPRNAETITPWHVGGLYPDAVVDDQLVALIQKYDAGPDSPESLVDELIEEYLALDYAVLTDLDALLERDRQMAGRIGGELGARIWAVVERDFRTRPQLFATGRANGRLMQMLARELAAQLDIEVGLTEIEEAWLDLYGGDVPPYNMAPVHPSVLRHFGVEWAGEPARFRWFYDGFLTAGEIARRAVRLTTDEATELFHRAEESGGEGLRQIASRLPEYRDSPFFRVRYAALLREARRGREAAIQYAAAARLLPPQEEVARAEISLHLARAVFEAGALQAPPRFDYNDPVKFGSGEAGGAALVEGWYPQENWGLWARGFSARVHFTLPPSNGGVRLQFRTTVHRDRNGTQAVRVFVNGRETALWWFECAAAAEKVIEIGAWVHEADKVEISFFVAQPTSPAEQGSKDDRVIGFGLTELTVLAL